MLWPTPVEYKQAISFFHDVSILDPKLQGGIPLRDSFDVIHDTGAYSIVFPIEVLSEVSSNTYALRCWTQDITRNIEDAETRYKEISDYLRQHRLPYFVDFEYVPSGIWVNEDEYPVTRMEWAEGKALCDFITDNLQDDRCLKATAAEFQKMVETLHVHQISHGDLQDGNILLKRDGTDIEIKLIDYDSLFVPALREQPDNIVGLPAYQHPQRIAGDGGAKEKVDYFSELVIYLSLLSLAENPDLWGQFGSPTGERLLFIEDDFKNPNQSDVFRELENLSPDVQQLTSKLKEFCGRQSIDQLKPLEEVLTEKPSDFLEIVLSFWERVGQKLKGPCEPTTDQLAPSEPVPPPSPPQDPSDAVFVGEVLDFWERDPSNRQESPPTKPPGPASANPPPQTPSSSRQKGLTNTRSPARDAYNSAYHHYKEDNWEAANNVAKKAFKLDSTYQPTRKLLEKIKNKNYNRGLNHWNNKARDAAIFYFKKVIDTELIFKEADCGVEESYYRQGVAVNAAKKVLEVDSTYQPARQLLTTIE